MSDNDEIRRVPGDLADGSNCVAFIGDDRVWLERDFDFELGRNLGSQDHLPNPLVARLSDQSVLTLRGAFVEQSNSNFVRTHQKISGRVAFLGPEPFDQERPVDELRVVPSNERVAVLYTRHRSLREAATQDISLGEAFSSGYAGARYAIDVIDNDRLNACSISLENIGIEVGISILLVGTVQGQVLSEQRHAHLTYDSPTSFEVAWRDMYSVCDFFSVVVGEVVSPIKVRLISGPPGQHGMRPVFDVYARQRTPGPEVEDKDAYRVLSSPDHSTDAYAQSLRTWMARRDEWRPSYGLLIDSLRRQREVSRDRFITAAAWFEAIPQFYLQPTARVGAEKILAAAGAAHRELTAAGEDVDMDRLQQLLGSINAVSLGRRLGDALAYLRNLHGPDYVLCSYDALSRSVPRIRGRFAHGDDAFLGPDGSRIYEATMLLELICHLLTTSELNFERIHPGFGHPLNYALMDLPNRV